MSRAPQTGLEQFFADRPAESRELFDAVRTHVESLGPSDMRVTKSQIAWSRRVAFAWAWIPSQYLGTRDYLAPLVLTVGLHHHDASPRWKEVVEPRQGVFIHHLELRRASDLDDEVDAWLAEAFGEAG